MTVTRKIAQCSVAALLAWAYVLMPSGLGLLLARMLRDAGWPRITWWFTTVTVSDVLPAALFVLGCALLRQVFVVYGSGYRRLPLVLAAIQLCATVIYVSTVRFNPPDWLSDLHWGTISMLSIMLTVSALIGVLEPHVSAPLDPRGRRVTMIWTAVAALSLMITPLGLLLRRPMFIVGYAVVLMLGGVGVPVEILSFVSMAVWIVWLSYLVARTAVAWTRRQKSALTPYQEQPEA